MEFRELGRDMQTKAVKCRREIQTDGDLQNESVREDVLKLTTLHGNIRGWILHISTPSACCHGDWLQEQQWGGSGFNVCFCLCVCKVRVYM